MLKYRALIALVTAVNALTVTAFSDDAKSPPGARNILEKHDQSGVAGKEAVIGTAVFPAGAMIGFHTHPGDEAGYVVKGSMTLKARGLTDKSLRAGDRWRPRFPDYRKSASP